MAPMRFVLALAACLALPAAANPVVLAAPAKPVVRLDRPGALEELAASNPEHHRRALEIIRVAQVMPCGLRLRTVLARYDAHDVHCEPALIFTSYPAQRDVRFSIDDTAYWLRVTMVADATLLPAK